MLEAPIIVEINQFLNKSQMGKVELSKNLGCPYSTVSRWLNGHTRPSPVWERAVRGFIAGYKRKK